MLSLVLPKWASWFLGIARIMQNLTKKSFARYHPWINQAMGCLTCTPTTLLQVVAFPNKRQMFHVWRAAGDSLVMGCQPLVRCRRPSERWPSISIAGGAIFAGDGNRWTQANNKLDVGVATVDGHRPDTALACTLCGYGFGHLVCNTRRQVIFSHCWATCSALQMLLIWLEPKWTAISFFTVSLNYRGGLIFLRQLQN